MKTIAMATANPNVDDAEQPQPIEYIYISNHKVKYINTNYKKVSAKMYDYKCDVKLKVGDENFKAHRDVLSEASDYFSAMFSHDMLEKDQKVIEIKDVSPKGFAAMLDYFYHGHVTIDPSNVEGIIMGARFFHVEWLLDICCDFLVKHLSLENYSAVVQIADKYWLGDLQLDIFKFIGENIMALCKQDKFYDNLSFDLLLDFLSGDIYCNAPEYSILEVVFDWVKNDWKTREDQLLPLLRQIRFPTMEVEELECIPDRVLKYEEIRDMVEDAKNYSLNIMGQCLKNATMYRQRGAQPALTVLWFSNEDQGGKLIYRDPTYRGIFFEELGPTGLETADYQAMSQAKIGNFLYAAGGYDDFYCSCARVFRFDPKYRSWTEVAPMNEPRVSFAMCSSTSKLFCVGGVNHFVNNGFESEHVLSSVEAYSPEENMWIPSQPMPVRSSDQAAEFVKGCLYVTGGISAEPDDPVPLDTLWCHDLEGTEGWVPKQNMLNGRQGHSMTAYKNKLFVIGGFTTQEDRISFKEQTINEVYDLETGQWTQIASTPETFGQLFKSAGMASDKLFTIGGIHVNANIYMYDPETDTWEEADVIGPNVQQLAVLDVAYPR